ncbi:organic cation transporter protein-like [Eupeodes corollae]|uniref:organic cation transporter protein-like n=1 Tax=Eupeodes corollae TaxID=290404 RepID=UPI0024938488|nr:organic cation transporter protein-like [Eupeodes corollae]
MVGTINNFGQFLGIPLGGYLSDRYGRSTVMAWGSALSTVMGILRSFSPNYYIFVLLGFLDNLFGSAIFGIAFVLALEFVGPSIRVHACTLVPMFNSLGRVLLAYVVKSFHNWRVVERIFYIPALGFLSLSWVLPESVRWLLSREEEEKAIQILRKAAKINKRKLSDASIEKLLQANRKNLLGIDSKAQKFSIGDAFRAFPWRIMNISLCWFTNVFTFLGLSLNLGLLGGNKYDNFMYLSFIEIPGIWLPAVTMNRYGRKASQCGYLFLSGVSIMAMNFCASASNDSLRLILYLLGKMSITASFQVLYIFTSEIFPTNSRSTLGSFCSMIGRFGAMVAPQTPLLAKYYTSAPAILFACSAFLSGSLVLFLPETNNTVLPTTLQDAQKIGQKEINVKPETDTELEIQEKLLTSKA